MEIILHAMQRHLTHPRLQYNACGALRNLLVHDTRDFSVSSQITAAKAGELPPIGGAAPDKRESNLNLRMPCCAVLCYAMLCYAMLCYAMPSCPPPCTGARAALPSPAASAPSAPHASAPPWAGPSRDPNRYTMHRCDTAARDPNRYTCHDAPSATHSASHVSTDGYSIAQHSCYVGYSLHSIACYVGYSPGRAVGGVGLRTARSHSIA